MAAPGDPQALESALQRLLQSLLEIGICASDVQPVALESAPTGPASRSPGGLIGRKVTQAAEQMAQLDHLKNSLPDAYVPIDVLNYVDQGKNPHIYTKDLIERLAGENMYANGILSGVSEYHTHLNEQMALAFPELEEQLKALNPPAPKEEEREVTVLQNPMGPPELATNGTNGHGNGGRWPGINGQLS